MSRLPLGAIAWAAIGLMTPLLLAWFALTTGAGMGHSLRVCAEALHQGAAVPAIALTGLAASVLARGAGSVMAQVGGGARALRIARDRAEPAPPAVAVMAQRLGIRRLVVTDIDGVAFCAGLLRPTVVVGRDVVERLAAGPLAAILAHEACHARMRDPLRQVLHEATARGLWFAPVVRAAAAHRRLALELRADAAALAWAGRRSLLVALLAISPAPAEAPGIAAASALLGPRLDALGPGPRRPPSRWSAPARTLVVSALGVMVSLVLAIVSLAPGLVLSIGLTCCPGPH